MDGADLLCVLDQRVRLDNLLRRKKRHANETGQCFFPVKAMLGGVDVIRLRILAATVVLKLGRKLLR